MYASDDAWAAIGLFMVLGIIALFAVVLPGGLGLVALLLGRLITGDWLWMWAAVGAGIGAIPGVFALFYWLKSVVAALFEGN